MVACDLGKDEETPYADNLLGSITRGKTVKTKSDMTSLATALNTYYMDNGAYPDTMHINELATRLQPAYMVIVPTTDGWGRKLVYTTSGNSYQLFSHGQDGQRGTADDIVLSDGGFTQLPKELGQ